MKKYASLREKYPRFIYKSFRITHSGGSLKIVFHFHTEPNLDFMPTITIRNVTAASLKRVGERALQNFAFHCGLAEIPSYWKATCSPEIVIEAGYLNSEQIRWWKDLLIKGMGQFFYGNKINFRAPSFFKIVASGNQTSVSLRRSGFRRSRKLRNRYLVPVGGGKDSIVTIEKLKERGEEINAFLVNPTKAAKEVIKVAGIKKPIIVERRIDPTLLELNKRGYLNGHTPFTAVLSFLSVFCAVLFDYRHVAFSNEKSADEGNLTWRGMVINHQYSKSSGFEKKFQKYCKKYLAKNIHYFSFLRRYGELEISRIFANYPKYFSIFSSCNRGRKFSKRWCNNCPKCLFVYMTLYPFLEKKQMIKIFGKDLFKNKKMSPILKDLIDPKRPKPFECVGTREENRKSLMLSLQKAKKMGAVPFLLRKILRGPTFWLNPLALRSRHPYVKQ